MIDHKLLTNSFRFLSLSLTTLNLRFKDNLPGQDYMDGFIRRHPELTMRLTNSIKRARAALTTETVVKWFEEYSALVEGVQASNIWNYDETNLSQDPGAVKAIFQRGVKYAEEVRDHSKTSVSIMFCGSAEGQLLPPYMVYKAANLYRPQWTTGRAPRNGVLGNTIRLV